MGNLFLPAKFTKLFNAILVNLKNLTVRLKSEVTVLLMTDSILRDFTGRRKSELF